MSWASNSERWGKPQRKNKGTQEDLQPKKWFFLKPNKSSSKREREGQGGEVEGGKERRGKRSVLNSAYLFNKTFRKVHRIFYNKRKGWLFGRNLWYFFNERKNHLLIYLDS